jgi:hypothetical protein
VADAADAQGAQARLRSKQLLLDVLCERIRQAWPRLGAHVGQSLCCLQQCEHRKPLACLA